MNRTIRIGSYRFTILQLSTLEGGLSKITEAEFRDAAKNNAIKHASVLRTDKGYLFVVELSWKEGLHTLYTFRNEPRTWASLDRMMKYFEKHELNVSVITLQWNPKS
ncbi:hypothetical protein WL94_23205 [Burkholderia cepacia]|nr:hypothetical protein WL94_23205 [Burkholderia cepacia]